MQGKNNRWTTLVEAAKTQGTIYLMISPLLVLVLIKQCTAPAEQFGPYTEQQLIEQHEQKQAREELHRQRMRNAAIISVF